MRGSRTVGTANLGQALLGCTNKQTNKRQAEQATGSKQRNSNPPWLHYSSCLQVPTLSDWIWPESQADLNLSLPKLLSVMVFYHNIGLTRTAAFISRRSLWRRFIFFSYTRHQVQIRHFPFHLQCVQWALQVERLLSQLQSEKKSKIQKWIPCLLSIAL